MVKPTKKKRDHIIISPIWQGAMLCFNCGTRDNLKMPIPLSMLTANLTAFDKAHRKCKVLPTGRALKAKHDGAWRRYQSIKEAARIPV